VWAGAEGRGGYRHQRATIGKNPVDSFPGFTVTIMPDARESAQVNSLNCLDGKWKTGKWARQRWPSAKQNKKEEGRCQWLRPSSKKVNPW